MASGTETEQDWRPLPLRAGEAVAGYDELSEDKLTGCSGALGALICADAIRPSLAWLLLTPAPKNLATR